MDTTSETTSRTHPGAEIEEEQLLGRRILGVLTRAITEHVAASGITPRRAIEQFARGEFHIEAEIMAGRWVRIRGAGMDAATETSVTGLNLLVDPIPAPDAAPAPKPQGLRRTPLGRFGVDLDRFRRKPETFH